MRGYQRTIAVWICFSGAAYAAYDFTVADYHFGLRDGSLANVDAGLHAYADAIPFVAGDELLYAVERHSWLAYYKADALVPPNQHEARKQIFNQCLSVVDHIRPDRIGKKVEAYYFWKATCLSLWAQAAGKLSAAFRISELRSLIADGQAVGTQYMKGGILRLAAAIYSFEPMLSWWDLYNPSKGLQLIDDSLAHTQDQYLAYTVKAYALKQMGRRQDAIDLISNKIGELQEKLQAGVIDPLYAPETKLELRRMLAIREIVAQRMSKREEGKLLLKYWLREQPSPDPT